MNEERRATARQIEPVAYWSRWKPATLGLLTLALAIVPNVPGFGEGLKRTAFFYTEVGTPIRFLSSAVLAAIGIVLIALAVVTNVRALAVWIEGGQLYWRGLSARNVPLANITSARLSPFRGVITIETVDRRKSLAITASLLRSRRDVEAVLSAIRAGLRSA